jgi:predicted metalloprotease with PDZ domain
MAHMPARIHTLCLWLVLVIGAVPAAAQQTSVEPIRYTVSFPAPHTHYLEVSAVVPTGRQPQVELMMAVWTPGSYLVREFSRNVEAVTAAGADGRALNVEKTEKNHWRVATGGAPTVTVKYRVYAREMSVRTNWVEAGFALVNGAPTFMTLADGGARPHEVIFEPARGWQRSMTGLAEIPGGLHRYRAPDFDTLVDSPVVLGNPAVYEFDIDGKKHYLVNEGEAGVFDGARAARDLETMVREHRRVWGPLPYDKYVFLNLLTTEVGNGLEHKNSTVLTFSRWATRSRGAYLGWLGLASHEFFHTWNVKRLRPVELGPFDYNDEVYTRSLWIAEGITDYYSDLALHRAGLMSQAEFLDALSNPIEEVQTTPGRFVVSAEQASFDAWIKYYRPDENSINVTVSYYSKGAILGFLLDAKIRKATNGARSLDDVMRSAYQKFAGSRGFTPDDFKATAEQVAGTSLEAFWNTAVRGTTELDYSEVLDVFGLRFRPATPSGRAYLGVATRNDAGRLVVAQVRRDTPAIAAALNVDDEILAINDFRVRADQLNTYLDRFQPGDRINLLIARRDQLMRLDVTLGNEPARAWRLEVSPSATSAQSQQRAQWTQSTPSTQ